jgi:GT2 family glycosyltransferase
VHFRRPYDRVRTDLRFATGCAFLLRGRAVEQVGLLDEDFYSYWEDADYCLRLRRAGWRVACNPRAVVYHKGGLTNRYLSDLYIYYMIRNGFLCMKKNGRWYQWPSFALLFTLTSVAKYGVYLLATRPREARVVLDAVGDFVRGRFGRKDFAARPAAS